MVNAFGTNNPLVVSLQPPKPVALMADFRGPVGGPVWGSLNPPPLLKNV